MRQLAYILLYLATLAFAEPRRPQPLSSADYQAPAPPGVSTTLFASLERLARLVDISYCIGNTGVSKPFACLSRCDEFPNVTLAMTWSTGMFMKDSCGYVAVDEGGEYLNEDGSSKPGAIIVAFRGTYSVANTVVDLSTKPQEYVSYPSPEGQSRPCTNCTVHSGFFGAWECEKDEVIAQLIKLRLKHPKRPVQLVGHSLGGAVASLAALELKTALGWDNVVVTTFGEPRIGNKGLVNFIDDVFRLHSSSERSIYRRVTHIDDPVPLLPPGEWGYRSHAGEIFITKGDLAPEAEDVHMCIGDKDPSCSAGQDSKSDSLTKRLFHFADAGSPVEEFVRKRSFPTRLKLWQLFFAHRDYFWRLGLCLPSWGWNDVVDDMPDEL
jgi:pimeloyl-ACP methyl ester carboxylesterase